MSLLGAEMWFSGSWRLSIILRDPHQLSAFLPSHGTPLSDIKALTQVLRSYLSLNLMIYPLPMTTVVISWKKLPASREVWPIWEMFNKCLMNWIYADQALGTHGVGDVLSGHQVCWESCWSNISTNLASGKIARCWVETCGSRIIWAFLCVLQHMPKFSHLWMVSSDVALEWMRSDLWGTCYKLNCTPCSNSHIEVLTLSTSECGCI